MRLSAWALPGIPEIVSGDDLGELILSAIERTGEPLADGDVLVVTSKIVSKAEGRFVDADQHQAAIEAETVRTVATRVNETGSVTRIVENRLGIVAAAAGVDASNTPAGTVLLLPRDPDASARALAEQLRESSEVEVGVLISDTLGRPWRDGQTDVAIGAAGVHVFAELQDTPDATDRPLVVTRPCIADELAGAADLVKGKTTQNPVAVLRGAGRFVGALDLPGARSIVRIGERDMFRLGSDEAYAEGFAAGKGQP